MSKTVIRVTVLACGRKVKDSSGKEYEIDFNFSNLEQSKIRNIPGEGSVQSEIYFPPDLKHRGQIQANGKIEIL